MSKKKNAERVELLHHRDDSDDWGMPKTEYDYREFLFNDVTRDLLFPELDSIDSVVSQIALAARRAYDEGEKLLKALASSGLDIASPKKELLHDVTTRDAIKTLLFWTISDAVIAPMERLAYEYTHRKASSLDDDGDYGRVAHNDLSTVQTLVTARLSKLPEYHLLLD